MKPVVSAPLAKCVNESDLAVIKTEMVTEGQIENKLLSQNLLLDALRNTYISEKSTFNFCNDVENTCMEQLARVSLEKQGVVEELVQQFERLSNEERLLFFLRLPISSNTHPHSSTTSKLGVLASRVEIRRTAAWIRSHLQEDCDASIPKRDVYDKYLEYCQASRMVAISIADFGKVMKHMYPSVRPRRLGTRGKSQYCYAGMSSCQHLKRPDIYAESPASFSDDFESQILGSASYEEQCGGNHLVHPHAFLQEPCTVKDEYPVPSTTEPSEFLTSDISYHEAPLDGKCVSKNFGQYEIQDCSHNEKKCRLRKPFFCQKGRYRRYIPIQPKPLKDINLGFLDLMTDGQVEEEVAQYFQSDSHNFCRPLEVVKGSGSGVPADNTFYRSLSSSGGCRDLPSLESRSQSSVGMYGPLWAPYETSSCRNSSASVGDGSMTPFRSASREATEKLAQLQLRPRSCISRTSCTSVEQNPTCTTQPCGFTPISPSPVPWRSYSSALPEHPNFEMFAEPDENSMNPEMVAQTLRPRSFSSNEMKWNLKRDFQNAFNEPVLCSADNGNEGSIMEKNNTVWGDKTTECKPECSENRSQSLPTFKDDEQNSSNFNSVTGITCEELTEILENSMSVEIGELLPSGSDILPQFDTLFSGIKHPTDLMVTDEFTDKVNLQNGFPTLTSDNVNPLNATEGPFTANFGTYL